MSLFRIYKKYPKLNCAVSCEVPIVLFVPKPTTPRSELQNFKQAKISTVKQVVIVLKLDGKSEYWEKIFEMKD